MTQQRNDVHLAGAPLPPARHVCAFFQGSEEASEVLLPFIKEGLERKERAFHIVDPERRADHLGQLQANGIDTAAAERDGQLEVRVWHEAYLREGHFDQNRMVALIQEVLNAGHEQGYPLTRLVAEMEWALEDRPGVHDLVEYETRLNYVLPNYPDPVVCMYDLRRFGSEVVMDILRTHPMVLIGGMLQENPFYVPPDGFLQELRARS
jgi:hypothetical protein